MAKKTENKKKAVKKPAKAKKPAPSKAAAKGAKSAKKPAAKMLARGAKKVAPKKVVAVKKPVAKVVAVAAKKGPVKALAKAAKPIPAAKIGKKEKAGKAPSVAPTAGDEVEVAADGTEESDEVVLTDAEGRRYCRVKDCDQLASVDGYCRYHYLLYWKRIQVRKKILTEGKLERYIEELTARYPDKFLDMLRKDLRSDKEFLAAIAELEIDESATENEFEDEAQTYIDEVRGMGEPAARDEEDF